MIVLNDDAQTFTYLNLHKAFGLSVLFWMKHGSLIGLWPKHRPMCSCQKPKPSWHIWPWPLYALLLAMPIAGFLLSMYGNPLHPVSMFGLFDIPVIVTPSEEQADFFENLHTNIIWTLLLVFSGLHLIGALYHQFIKKDKLINRMR